MCYFMKDKLSKIFAYKHSFFIFRKTFLNLLTGKEYKGKNNHIW